MAGRARIATGLEAWRHLAAIRREALEAALAAISPDDRRIVEGAAEALRRNARRQHPQGYFGRLTALEVVAAVGIFLEVGSRGDGLPERGRGTGRAG